MKTKTAELEGAALDWAVAKCEGLDLFATDGWYYPEDTGTRVPYRPSTNWAQGGPIIEREKIDTTWDVALKHKTGVWTASLDCQNEALGDTPLIAAMRCYVASKLGDEVEIPEELR